MAGDFLRQNKTGTTSHSPLDGLVVTLAGIIAGLIIVGFALWMYETKLASMDRINQERISWDCNGNHVVDCVPYHRA